MDIQQVFKSVPIVHQFGIRHKGKKYMKSISLVLIVLFVFSGCVYKQETINAQGVIIDEKYIIKRPVKDFIKKVEFE